MPHLFWTLLFLTGFVEPSENPSLIKNHAVQEEMIKYLVGPVLQSMMMGIMSELLKEASCYTST